MLGGAPKPTPTPCWELSRPAPDGAAESTSAKGLSGMTCFWGEAGRDVLCDSERAN